MSEKKYTEQIIQDVSFIVPEKLFTVSTSKDPSFSFKAGQFARLGLKSDPSLEEPDLWRAFSMVSLPQNDSLSFYAVVVPTGQFSPLLAQAKSGDSVYVDKTAFGFLTIEQFPQGGDLFLLATGTGLSAYLSMLQDEQTWERFNRVVLVHGTRHIDELSYQKEIHDWTQNYPNQFIYLPVTTKEQHLAHVPCVRLTELIATQQLESLTGVPFTPENARVMLCGNPDMVADARKLLSEQGFAAGRRGNIGNVAVEKYW